MSKFYYARMKFEEEDGFYQIELDREGRALICQWLPNIPETLEALKDWKAEELTPDELEKIYRNGVRT